MGQGHKFDVKKLERLRDPERLSYLNPDTIWAVIAPEGVGTVVDLGAGIGFFAIPFSRKIPQGKIYGCDLSEEMVGNLKMAIEAEGVSNIIPVTTGEVQVPLEDGIADLVFMVNLHHEFDHPMDSMAECRRLLRPAGRVAVIDWKPEETPSGPPLHVRVTPEQVIEQLTQAGFETAQPHPVLAYHYIVTASNPAG